MQPSFNDFVGSSLSSLPTSWIFFENVVKESERFEGMTTKSSEDGVSRGFSSGEWCENVFGGFKSGDNDGGWLEIIVGSNSDMDFVALFFA